MSTPTKATGTMRASVRTHYGSADVVHVDEVPVPTPTGDRVLVRIEAAGLDRGAWHIMSGEPPLARLAFGLRRPKQPVLGSELCGVVEAVGPEVTDLAPGTRVYGLGSGTFAELALARRRAVAAVPEGLRTVDVAALPVSGLTALQALRDRAGLQPGQRVLVLGASGGVGVYAVQIAKAMGAEVTGVCSAAKADLVRSLGADRVDDYATSRITDAGITYDVIVDTGGNRALAELRRVLAPAGALVIVGGEDAGRWTFGLGRTLHASIRSWFGRQRMGTFVASSRSADLDALAAMATAGSVHAVVDRSYTLAEVPQAMRDLEAGRIRGKAVILPR
jgi:NADPH:quinone reductase-like Zn-dependent oxidoreductase